MFNVELLVLIVLFCCFMSLANIVDFSILVENTENTDRCQFSLSIFRASAMTMYGFGVREGRQNETHAFEKKPEMNNN